MPQAAVPIAAEAAVASTLTAAEIAAAQAAAAELAAAQAAAAQTVAATNASVLSAIAPTAAPAATTAAGAGTGGAGGISSLVNTTGGPTTFEQVFSQGQEIAKGSTELGKLASTASEFPAAFPEIATAGPTIPPSASVQVNPLPQVGPPAASPPVAPPPAAPPPPPVAPPAPPPTGPDVLSPAEQARKAQLLNNPYTAPPYVEPPFVPPSPDAAAHISRIENLNGIETLAKEVGAQTPNMQGMQGMQTMTSGYGAGAPPGSSVLPPMAGPPAPGIDKLIQPNLSSMGSNLAPTLGAQTSAFNTAPTLTQYGAGAPQGSSVLPSMPVGSSPAPGIDQLVQTDLSSMGSNMPPAPPFANQTMVNGVQPAVSVPSPTPNPLINETNMGSVYDKFATPSPNPLTATQADVARTITQPPAAPPGMPAYYGYTGNPTDLAPEVLKDAVISPTVNNPFLMQSEAASAAEPSGLQGLYNEFKAMPLKDKALTGLMASSAYQMLNQPKPYEPKKYKPTFKPGLYTGYQPVQPTPYQPNYAHGGLADLGGYSDGGRMLKGPGDGMSDDIPATIANKQPARLANEEFVVPADVVSHLGNGSSEAGAKVLYKMMDRVRQARTGNKKQGKQINPEKYLA